MPLASGFLEILNNNFLEGVKRVLKENDIEIVRIEDNKIVYLIERASLAELESILKFMKGIEGVLNVYLAYYSLGQAGD